MWSSCLEGPGTHADTMDLAGPFGPAWMRLCPAGLHRPWPREEASRAVGAVSHCQCKCVRGNSTVQLWTVLAALKRSRGKRPNDLHGAASLSNEFGS